MIYSYKPQVTPGPYGTVITYQYNPAEDVEDKTDPAVRLGKVNDREYISVPDSYELADLGAQPEEIDFKQDTITPEILAELKKQRFFKAKQEITRAFLKQNGLDEFDLLDVLLQLAEFCTVAVSALMADKAGLVTLEGETLQKYGARAAGVLQLIQTDYLTIRGATETPKDMMTSIAPVYNKITEIFDRYYVKPLQEAGFKADYSGVEAFSMLSQLSDSGSSS